MELSDLRLISEGVDIDYIESFNECASECMNEAFGEAYKKSLKVRFGKEIKAAKKLMNEGKKLAKTDSKAAIEKYDEALKILQDQKKEINKIEDDDAATIITITVIRAFLPVIAYAIIGPINIFTTIVGGIASLIAIYVWGNKGSSDLTKVLGDPEYAKKINMDLKTGKVTELPHKDGDGYMGFSRAEAMACYDRMIETIHKCKNAAKAAWATPKKKEDK